jgi:Bacterial Ig domain
MKDVLRREKVGLALVFGAFCGTGTFVAGQSVPQHAVQASASVQSNPAQITLSWPADTQATGYTVYRKGLNDSSWGTAIVSLTGSASSFTDSNVVVGGAYEYRISKSASGYSGVGYIYGGIQAPLMESRGKVVLLVDSTFTSSLAMELARLEQDLVGDGWTVLRHDVPRMAVDPANASSSVWAARSNELANAKALILADYNDDPTNVNTVILFGHVPVPYSGDISPDEHPDHTGAWPCDAWYGNVTGPWTDSSALDESASDTRNWNQIGDGKFDQSLLPSDVTLQVGRVDMANLPAFPQSETALLRQYLEKDHNFRVKAFTAQRRGLIDDNLGVLSSGETPAVNGWRNFAPFFGATNIYANLDWFGTLSNASYLWGYGCGAGTYTSAAGVGSSTDFVTQDPQAVFTMFFGSYFGDWDSQNNFLRAALGTTSYTLTTAWVGRPNWMFHHMGLGETIGFSTRLSQNNNSLYSSGLYSYWVHIALLGDPTLRMHVVAPPSGLLAVTNGSGGVALSWNASPDTVAGYHVYSAETIAGPFTRLNTALLTVTNFTTSPASSNVYMIRAVNLEVSGSGSYSNASEGIFQSLDGGAGAPSVVVSQPTNNALFVAPATIQLRADVYDPANGVTNVAFYANGVRVGDVPAPPYTMTWSNAPGGLYSLTASAASSVAPLTNSAPVMASVDNGGSPRLSITSLGMGSYAISGDEVMGRVYQIQFVPDARVANWQSLGAATGGVSGVFQIIDSNAVPLRFYRSVYP